MNYRERENTGWWYLLFAVATISMVLLWAMTIDLEGRKDVNHPEPLPAGVVQLSTYAYLVDRDSKATPETICLGDGSTNRGPVRSTTQVPALNRGLYVECTNEQTWNDNRPKSVNYAHALVKTVTSPMWWAVEGVLFFLCSIYAICILTAVGFDRMKTRKRTKAERRRKAADAEDARLELAAAFAKGDIEMPEFEAGLNKIYEVAPRRK